MLSNSRRDLVGLIRLGRLDGLSHKVGHVGSQDDIDRLEHIGRDIIKKSGERFPPFYGESYDRIIRDDAELEERWQAILDSPVQHELCEDSDNWASLWVANSP